MSQLILAAVPLGNVGDASDRLKLTLSSATHIAAEDSRKFSRLCKDLGIEHRARVISFFEGNEGERIAELIAVLESGNDLVVVTDAGMPSVSDPGYRIARECVKRNISITVLPGPSAVITALALSGLPTDRFCFEGFVPRTNGARDTFYEALSQEVRTIILFEAPHRISESLSAAAKAFGGNREVAICREMTKTYEEIFRGSIDQAITWSNSKEILGEITIVMAGFDATSQPISDADLVKAVIAAEANGVIRKDAIHEVAQRHGLPKRHVFDLMVQHKRDSE
jgi:16S rRNA (cytidine1402-2'-O)-methyltransferase